MKRNNLFLVIVLVLAMTFVCYAESEKEAPDISLVDLASNEEIEQFVTNVIRYDIFSDGVLKSVVDES